MDLFARVAEWAGPLWPLIGRHLFLSTVLAVPILLATLLLRRAPAKTRFALLVLASVSFVLPATLFGSLALALGVDRTPVYPLFARSVQTLPLAQAISDPVTFSSPPATERSVARVTHEATPTRFNRNSIYLLLAAIWAAGCAYYLCGLLKSRREVAFAVALRAEKTEREEAAFRRVSRRLMMDGRASLLVTRQILVPCVYGVRRPLIIISEGLAARLTRKQFDAILTHELMHVRRRDNLTGLWHHLLRAVFWFHPLVWFLHKLLLQEREHACDEEVVNFGFKATDYTSGIVRVFDFCVGAETSATCGIVDGTPVRERVTRIENYRPRRNLLRHSLLIFSSTVLLCVLSGAAGLIGHRPVLASAPPSLIEIEPWLIQEVAAKSPRMALTLAVVRNSGGGLLSGRNASYFWTPVELRPEDAEKWIGAETDLGAFFKEMGGRATAASTVTVGRESLIEHALRFEPGTDGEHATLTLEVARGAELDPSGAGLELELAAAPGATPGKRIWIVKSWKLSL